MKDSSAIYTETAGELTPKPPMEELTPISSSNPPLTGCLPYEGLTSAAHSWETLIFKGINFCCHAAPDGQSLFPWKLDIYFRHQLLTLMHWYNIPG